MDIYQISCAGHFEVKALSNLHRGKTSDHNVFLIGRMPFLQVTEVGPGFYFGKPLARSQARPSLKKPGSVRPYPKPD